MPTTSAPTGPLGPIDIELHADIRAPAEIVWRLLVDWDNMGLWMLEATRLRVTTEHREGIGVEIEARVRIGGITTTDTVRVTHWEPPHVLSASHEGWVKGHAVMRCIPTAGGTRLEWTERLVPPLGPIGGIGIRLFKPLMTRVFVRDLTLLKRLAETRAGTRPPGPQPSPAAGGGRRAARSAAGQNAGADGNEPEQRRPAAARAMPPRRRAAKAASDSSQGARPAEAAPGARRRARGPEASSLFARWFWLVYLPLGLTGVVMLLAVAGLLPRALRAPVIALTGLWSALALRLLIERRRRGVAIPAPRSIVFGIAAVASLALGGGLLAWIGIGKVSSSEGLAMLLVGCFFMLMAVFAPMFKLVDSALRLAARIVTRRSKSPEPGPSGPAAADSGPAAADSGPEAADSTHAAPSSGP